VALVTRLFASASIACVATAIAASAANAAPLPPESTGVGAHDQAANAVGELIVTAERREEAIGKVPIAVSALSGSTLETQGVVGFADLSTRVPSLRFGAGVTGGENVITLRGLGSQNTTPGGDSPVAYNVNGVYVQQTTAIDPEFYDVQRVEVLRGPQGTLYGRNSVGGSVNVITAQPTDVFGASADAMVGNYSARTFRGWINGPLIDSGDMQVDGRLTAVSAEHSPYATNLSAAPTATHTQDGEDYWMVRGQLKIQFSPKVNLLLFADYSQGNDPAATNTAWWETPARYVTPPLGIPIGSACDFSTAAKFNPRVFCHDALETATNTTQLYSGTLNWELPWADFTSVTAYERGSVAQVSDGDGSNLPIAVGAPWTMNNSQFSQEFRLASRDSASPIRWLAGFIYFYANDFEDFGYSDTGFNDTFPLPGGADEFNFLSHGYTKTSSWAPFGQVDFDLAKTHLGLPLTFTLGLRYSQDRKYGFNYLDYQLPVICGGSCGVTQGPFSKTWGQPTGKFGAQYQIDDRTMAYASVSRGYLAGGNIIGLAHIYGPETLWSYEAGLKTRFLDDRFQLNIAAYHEDIQNLQVFVQSSTQSGINNVNGVTGVNGVETEINYNPVDDLHLNAALTFTDARYGTYITTDTRFSAPGPGCNAVTLLCNFKGNDLNQTPPYTVDLGAEYVFHTSFGTITPRVDAFFSGKVEFLPDNFATSEQHPYHLTNVSLTWNSPDERYRIEAFGKNLENANVISNDGLQSITLGQQVQEPDNFVYYPPRTFGVRFAVKVGG
jgi:iron complex outermembrane receptor protein